MSGRLIAAVLVAWALEKLDERTYAFHWGAPGFRSFALVDPDDAQALVVFTNGNQGLEMMDELVELLTGRRHALLDFYMPHPND